MNLTTVLEPILGDIGRPLRPEDSPESLPDWDSLKQIEIIVALEDAFELELTTSEILKLNSIGAILEILRRRGTGILL